MELRHYLKMLLSGWWIIALAMLAGISVALALSYAQVSIYRASARLLVRPNPAVMSPTAVVDSLNTLDKRSIISTYAEILKSNRMYNQSTSGLGVSPEQLSLYTRTAVALPDSNILEVSVQGPDPQVTAALANNIGQYSVDYVKSQYQAYNIDFLDPAVAPTDPISPQPARDASLAAALGLILGAILAFLREQMRTPLELLRQRSMVDSVSTVYTRRYFQRRLEEEIAARRGDSISIGFVELSGLRDLSDSLPDSISDRLIRQVAAILKSELRGGDIVGRWDDATFSILLPATPETAAKRTLERIRSKLSTPLSLNGARGELVDLQPSAGGVTTQGNETASVVIDRAKMDLDQNRQNLKVVAA